MLNKKEKNMSECVFLRYETKYVIDENQYLRLIEFAESRLKPDNYGKTNVQSLYFDTNDFRLIRRSIEKPFYKEKLRLRHYGFTDENAFLELKKSVTELFLNEELKLL